MAEPFLWGSPFSLPTTVPWDTPHVMALRNGTFLVLGVTGADWDDRAFKAWIYNADGSLKEEKSLEIPNAYRVEANAYDFEKYVLTPVAAELPDGRIGITWSMSQNNGAHYRVAWLSLYGADLQPLGPAQSIAGLKRSIPYSDGTYASDDVISLSDGRLAVAYRSYAGEAFLRILGTDGTLSNPISVGTTFGADISTFASLGSVIDLTVLSNGKMVVGVRASETANHFYIVDPSDAANPTLSDCFTVPVNTPSGLNSIEVTALEVGGFVVTWVEMGKTIPTSEPTVTVKFQVFDAAGGKITGEPLAVYASAEEASSVGTPYILSLPGGGFALAAQVVPSDFPMNSEVRLEIFDATGARVSDRLLVSRPAAEGLFSLKGLSLLADGRIAVHLSSGIQIVDPRDKAISLKGTAQNDYYIGTAFNDTFESSAGADRLEGAGGNDTYQVDNAGDRVVEKANEGIDTIETSVSYALSAHVEHLTATGSASVALTGNELSNTITGNAGNNTLDGGAGADVLNGGAGFDFASFASSATGVAASLGGGAGDSFVAIEGIIGSGFADTLIGNGTAELRGATGGDTYRVRAGDVVVEALGQGRDTVLASTSYALSAGAEIEVLKLTGVLSRASASLTGSNTANEIVGHVGRTTIKAGSGNDKIYGGLGNDSLWGQSGRDIFVFDTRPNKSTNVDRVYDFRSKDDSIYLDNKYFTNLGSGTATKPKKFKADMFVAGKTAQDAEDRIVYDRKTGALYYDQDGTGSKAQVKIATIGNKAKLSYHDFFVV
ncbi:calcium-binding protein [Microvirga arabica]|uniref:calcium-binding protein n=1 Tax=Microvirga arabica TaxID=1128671 RepID=UPI00193AD19D|nr:calcium-binding protein [Microvirga arabica]MBM1169814.1 calcium-binding protein [Microvirga arabica]